MSVCSVICFEGGLVNKGPGPSHAEDDDFLEKGKLILETSQ